MLGIGRILRLKLSMWSGSGGFVREFNSDSDVFESDNDFVALVREFVWCASEQSVKSVWTCRCMCYFP